MTTKPLPRQWRCKCGHTRVEHNWRVHYSTYDEWECARCDCVDYEPVAPVAAGVAL